MSASEVSTFWMQWYYATDGQRLGPVPHFELERLVRSGTIKSDSLLWRQGMNNWQTLDEVRAADPTLISISQPPPLTEKNRADADENASGEHTGRGDDSAARDPQSDFATGTFRGDRALDNGSQNDSAYLNSRPYGDARADSSFSGSDSASMVFAGFWSRAVAHLVDAVILYFAWNILVAIVGHFTFPDVIQLLSQPGYKARPEDLPQLLPFFSAVMGLGLGLTIFYDTFFILKYSATPGKLLLGLQVVRADGAPLGFGRIVARCVAKAISGMTLGIGFLVVAVDEQKRGLHDFFCSTRVIKKRR